MKILVMIVEDSVVVREMITHIVSSDPRFEIVAAVASGEAALRELERCSPHVISLDIRLPGMDGFETTQRIMSAHPTPIVVLSADVDHHALNISMNALRAGALAVLEKPPGLASDGYASAAKRICDQLALMSEVKVVRQRISRDLDFGTPKPATPPPAQITTDGRTFEMLSLVASTGGPNALMQVLQSLPKNFPAPIALVQHITESFTESFAAWLAAETPFETCIVRDGEEVRAGRIHLAPANHHLVVERGRFRLTTEAPVSMQRPSGTTLLSSMARAYGSGGLGVLLTGMGDDGATGLLDVRRAGGFTVAEHRSTAVVYGMPGAAERLGAAREILPLNEIGPRVRELFAISTGSLKYAK